MDRARFVIRCAVGIVAVAIVLTTLLVQFLFAYMQIRNSIELDNDETPMFQIPNVLGIICLCTSSATLTAIICWAFMF